MIGIPGSGKTTLVESRFPHHTHISLDKIIKFSLDERYQKLNIFVINNVPMYDGKLSKNRKIEYVMLYDALKKCGNVIIDDTNITKKIRKRHIDLAQKYGAHVKAILFQNILQAYEQNKKREKSVPTTALNNFYRELEYQHEDEGFESIEIIY